MSAVARATPTPAGSGVSEATPDLPAVEDGLFTWPADEPRLIGSRCASCSTTTFPAQPSCPRCTSTDVHERLLARRGTLWTWTVQGFRPKSPPYEGSEDFVPYPVGYVELPGEAKVESLLVDVAIEDLAIGMAMELVIVPFHSALTGEDVATFAFRPLPDSRHPEEDPS
jgi:uncharacterized OB-fold protein